MTPTPKDATPAGVPDAAEAPSDYFCQWCYDRGLRYSRPGPWGHAIGCPHNPSKPDAKQDMSFETFMLMKAALEVELEAKARALSDLSAAEVEVEALRVCFAEASHNAGPAFVAHGELKRLKANEGETKAIAQGLQRMLTASGAQNAALRTELEEVKKERETANHSLLLLTDERERFIQYLQSIKLADGQVGPVQLAKSHIENLVATLAARDAELARVRKALTSMDKAASALRRQLGPKWRLYPEYQDFADAHDNLRAALATTQQEERE